MSYPRPRLETRDYEFDKGWVENITAPKTVTIQNFLPDGNRAQYIRLSRPQNSYFCC